MPLVRFDVRNEYGSGQRELYKEVNREDPKAVLDGVAVAGLVGILRQLGDLAEFAAEVFHGLQEHVMSTASRSHKLTVRMQHIEAALPPLEKAVLAQTSHIHFAYAAGSEWHPRIQNEQNHFIHNDLPRFIMDSYEECRDPPRLHLLDKFDTGGSGSCLKRYSDPTYFRRSSGNATELDAEKVQKDQRTHKSKKKRSSQRNGDVVHNASVSNHSGRMQFVTPTINEQTSLSHTDSTIGMTLKSNMGDQSSSFDSRTGSGYIECVFHLNPSVQPEEGDSKELSSSFLEHNDVSDSVFPDGQPGTADYNSHDSSSPEQIAAPSLSCVTWDEKAEIMPRDQHCDGEDVLEVLASESDLDTQETLAIDPKNDYPLDIMLDDKNTPKSSSSWSQLDEVESEPDNFVDALNTIESESENDIDCQTKHEIEQSFSITDNVVEEIVHEVKAYVSDNHPSDNESHTASHVSSNEKISCEFSNSVPSKSFAYEETSHITGRPSMLDSSPGMECSASADSLDSSKVESASDPSSSVSATSVSNLQEPLSDKTLSSSYKSQESQADLSGVHFTTLWTNGSLLGLEPSKPPHFAISNTTSPDSVIRSKGEAGCPPNQTSLSSNDGGKPGRFIKESGSMERVPSSKCSLSWHEDHDVKLEKPDDSCHSSRFSHGFEDGVNATTAVLPGKLQHAVLPTEFNQENDEDSSQTFGFGHRLLANSFSRKISLAHENKHEPARLLRTGAPEWQSQHSEVTHQATPEKAFNEQFGYKYSIDSFMSSPPLEHMKISFHPIDGFEASKLKLKFPDGSFSDEGIRDMFPLFQLVPETAMPLHNVGSDSDNGTFCRSSPYISDDCLSHNSESDSDHWESDESPESKDHELYDAFHGMSPIESFPSSLLLKEPKSTYTENASDPSLSTPLLDLPCFDAVNPVVNRQANDNLDTRSSTPLAPPPPPVLRRFSKLHAHISEDISEGHGHAFDIKSVRSVSQQPKLASADEQRMNEDSIAVRPNSKQQDQKRPNQQREINQSANGKCMDEQEDFLHQIRTKSFTLRRTATAKPTLMSVSSANDTVTAILEKANAIRQAVASDDGEYDDTWSDN